MQPECMSVGIIVERRRLQSRWADYGWAATEVLAGVPDAEPWTVLQETDAVTRYYAGSATVSLYRTETEPLKHNIDSDGPSVYVVLRRDDSPLGVSLLLATVDPGEAHAHADTGDDIVDAVPMPLAVQEWVAAFVAANHVERVKYKRQRDRADPEALAVGRHTAQQDDDD